MSNYSHYWKRNWHRQTKSETKQMFPDHNSTFIKTLFISFMPDFLTLGSGRKEVTQGVFLLLDVGLYSAVKTTLKWAVILVPREAQ